MRRVLLLWLACVVVTTACSRLGEVRVADFEVRAVETPTQSLMYAADGSLIATLRYANRENADLDDLPDVLLDAVVAAEDRRFYAHDGIDLRGIVRAALANQRAGRVVEGGSTITQQLIKNRYFPDGAETLERKASEAHLARELERTHSKDEILLDYLNTIYLGEGAYGITAASRTYFGIEPAGLELHQVALLAGLIRSPEHGSPHDHPRRAEALRRRVLEAMAEEGMVSADRAAGAAALPLGVQPPPPPPRTRFPYFVQHVKQLLVADPRFGSDEATRIRRLYGGGLRIHTTIEPRLQADAQQASRAFFHGPGDPEVAIAVVRPGDGHLVAAVGGRDFSRRQFDLAAQARRQPGSTFKTFALVAALKEGIRLDTLLDSGSASYVLNEDEVWTVASATSGPLTLEEATARSSNGAYARLALQLGGGRISDQAAAMGISSPVGTNPAIVLGGLSHGVSPLEMAGAYATLANAGVHVPTTVVTKITDAGGAVVWEPEGGRYVAMDGETAWLATKALQRVITDGTGQLARLRRPAAGKTGTVQSYRDAWFVGYTPQLSTAVWMGYPERPRPMLNVHGVARVEGGTWPARIWRTFMTAALAGEPAFDFSYPAAQAITVQVDPESGQLATEWCPYPVAVTGLRGELPTAYCTLHGPPETSSVRSTPSPGPATSAPATPAPPRDGRGQQRKRRND